ncbi:MAG: EAL domain-containing protein [Gammaproteobacteria bacterium]|nr:EAL domain-containing protein [Gammaproteobacteria bacterium]
MNNEEINVLLIDDDIVDIRLVKALLKKVKHTRFKVEHICDVNDARLHLAADNHDVYLMDYYLGESDGLELIREARRIGKTTPIIVITGAESEEVDEQVMNAGAADYLPKEELSASLLDRTIKHALERTRYIKKLEYLANRDPLTNLANRAMFEEHLERTLAISKRRNQKFAVLLLDLDRFKEINDTLGHNIGDMLLSIVANRLTELMRKEDIIARIGGDEFTILLSQVENSESVVAICNKILTHLTKPTPINESSLFVSTSIGVAMFPDNADTPIGLMQKADLALYKAKTLGKNNFQFFSEELRTKLQYETEIEKALRLEINTPAFSMYYQPQYNLLDNRLDGFEALIRWDSTVLGKIPPEQFIPIAEKSGLILELGDWIIETVCRQLHEWNKAGYRDLNIAINMSPKQLKKPNFYTHLNEQIIKYNLVPGKLTLELTESIFIDASEHNIGFFKHLKQSGISLALDDFGTGYSALAYLKNFPLDKLKIDRSFVSGPSVGQQEEVINQAIISLAHGLNMQVIAEGVETKEQANLLMQQGCDLAQGLYFNEPLNAELATKLLQKDYGAAS